MSFLERIRLHCLEVLIMVAAIFAATFFSSLISRISGMSGEVFLILFTYYAGWYANDAIQALNQRLRSNK